MAYRASPSRYAFVAIRFKAVTAASTSIPIGRVGISHYFPRDRFVVRAVAVDLVIRFPRFDAWISASRARISFFTKVADNGFSGVNRIVPLLVSNPCRSFAIAATTRPLMGKYDKWFAATMNLATALPFTRNAGMP